MKRSALEIFDASLNVRKTQAKYDIEWQRFVRFLELPERPTINDITEEMIVQYLDFLHTELELAPTTVWSSFSKVDTTYQDMGGSKLQDKYPRSLKVLKHYQSGYVPNRATTFTFDQAKSFLENAPNEGKNLLHKAVVCMALYGGLRCADLVNIENDDIEVNDTSGVWVRYSVSKQSGQFHKSNTYVVPKPFDAC